MCFKIIFLLSFQIILALKLSATSQNQTLDCKSIPSDSCGPNAACFDDPTDDSFIRHEGPYCKCNYGFVGAPKCAKNCRFRHECSDNEYCSVADGRKCVESCRPDSCPKGQCDDGTKECTFICIGDWYCDRDEYCDLYSNKCEKGCRYGSCLDGHKCDKSTRKCTTGCIQDSNCKEDEFCNEIDRKCRKGCRILKPSRFHKNFYSCDRWHYCDKDTRQCRMGCQQDFECPTDKYCNLKIKKCRKGCRLNSEFIFQESIKCHPGKICNSKTRNCMPGCLSDNDCKFYEFCGRKSQKCELGPRQLDCPQHTVFDLVKRVCRDGCKESHECQEDEYCNQTTKKCQKVCENFSCGKNLICEGKEHMKYCSCLDGFVPKKDKGCKKIEASDNLSLDCEIFCGNNGCYKKDNRIFCYCGFGEKLSDDPFCFFIDQLNYVKGQFPGPGLRPAAESEISVAAAMALSG